MESLPWDVRQCGGLDIESELVLMLGGESKAEDASVCSNILLEMELVRGGRGLWGEGRGMGGEVVEGDLDGECAIMHELKVVGQVGGRARDLIYQSNRLYGHDGHTLTALDGPRPSHPPSVQVVRRSLERHGYGTRSTDLSGP